MLEDKNNETNKNPLSKAYHRASRPTARLSLRCLLQFLVSFLDVHSRITYVVVDAIEDGALLDDQVRDLLKQSR